MNAQAWSVGRRLPRFEAMEKAAGRAHYIADISVPGMLHAAVLQSPHAHAIVRRYDVTAALSAPGVHAIVTGDDCPDGLMGALIKDEHAIAKAKVRYVGEPVAAVAADTEEQARAAALLIDVEYDELPAVLSPEEALAPGAPLVHENVAAYVKVFDAGSHGNVCSRSSYQEGDVEAAWSLCDVIVEETFQTQAQAHLSIEPCGALADIDPSGRITLWSANQSVFRVQANVCESLLLPMSKLRCLTPRVGGGFGNKMEAHIQPIVVMLAQKARRPVRLILTRAEDFEMVRVGHPFSFRMKTGASRDGQLIAREVEATLDGGAFADDSPGVLAFSLRTSTGPYRYLAARASGVVAYTNKLRSGAFRGFGQPQMQFGGEQQIDEIAGRLGIDPLEFRRRNALQPGECWFGGQEVASNGLSECFARVEEASGWRERAGLKARPGKRRGLGLAASAHISALLSTGAIVRMLEDGSIVLNTGATDIGQGSDTVLAQICAEALKVDPQNIVVASPDTDGSPYNWGTTASRVTYTTGRSVVGAADEVIRQAKEHASQILECAIDDLELRKGGRIGVKGAPGMEVTFRQIGLRSHWGTGGPIIGSHSWVFNQVTVDPKRAIATGNAARSGVFSFGAIAVDVEVDEASGKIEVLRAWSAVDVGRAINPAACEGQIEGAFVQGMGFALVEEVVWDGGRVSNPSMMDYKVPTSADTPFDIHALIVEAEEPGGPFGAKGAGEIGMNGVAAAIANAVAAATGCRISQLPLTPERVLRATLPAESAHAI
ncbi:MAG: xanthine dehydrogenase family protein molybdopterin-binding subunit [Pseudorhodoplanes sp.]|uniref:xanthine dehydrogenase family protein molybdopterin-binding subunit n=1 Tax=Pseudorhodoplanes sp. TaxID=1934341 RepID=UPI003D122453